MTEKKGYEAGDDMSVGGVKGMVGPASAPEVVAPIGSPVEQSAWPEGRRAAVEMSTAGASEVLGRVPFRMSERLHGDIHLGRLGAGSEPAGR